MSKILSADVKANVKQQEINYLVAVSYKFLQEVPSKLEIQCKKGMYFYLILVGIPSILILSLKNRGVRVFLLNGVNPLKVHSSPLAKVICRWSFTTNFLITCSGN